MRTVHWCCGLMWLICGQVFAASCWQLAGARYDIDPRLLWAIAKVESGFNPQAVNFNRDGTRDIGLMQVNSSHLAALQPYGYSESQLLDNGCASVMAGSWVLAGMIQRYGYNWRAVGAYNAGTGAGRDALRDRYARKVWRVYQTALR